MTLNQALQAKKLYEETGDAREARKMSVRIQEIDIYSSILCSLFYNAMWWIDDVNMVKRSFIYIQM